MDRFGRTTPSQQFFRSFRVAVLIALGLELFYVAIANAVLGFGWLERRLSSDPDELTVSFERPWTILPGRVHVRRFALRFEDDNVVLALALERAVIDFDLAALVSHRLHIADLDGAGLSVRLATKDDEAAKTKLYPPILTATPRRDEPEQRPSDARHWTIDVEGVDSTLSELWIREHRYIGGGLVRGGFRFVPHESLQVRPSYLELQGGELRYGAHETIARAVAGRAHSTLHEHPLSAHEGWQLFSFLDLDGSLDATIATLRASRGYWKDIQLDRGEGSFKMQLRVDRGRILPPSFAEYRTRQLLAKHDSFTLRGDARVRASANEDQGGTLSMSAERLDLWTKERPAVVATEVLLKMTSDTADIAQPWQLRTATFGLPDVRAADLGRLSSLVSGKALRPRGGAARARARARIDENGNLHGVADVELQNADLELARKVRVDATGRLEIAFQQQRADRASGDVTKFELVLDHARFRTANGSTRGGWLRVDSRALKYRDGKPTHLDAALRAGFPDAEPVLAALGIQPKGLGSVATALLDLEDLSVVARVRHAPSATTIEVTRANTDGLKAHGRWQRRQGKQRGAFLLETRLIDAGLLVRDGKTEIDWRVDEPWLTNALQELRLGESGS